jgi:hypothetical protein
MPLSSYCNFIHDSRRLRSQKPCQSIERSWGKRSANIGVQLRLPRPYLVSSLLTTLADVQPTKHQNVSESTNASPSDLTEGYVPPELPAQMGSLSTGPQLVNPPPPTAQAISIASLAHATKTHIPSPVPPATDPLAEPDHEIEERQPVTNLTKRQN